MELEKSLLPPVAKTTPHAFMHLGKTYTDAYAWLQDKADPQVRAYLEAENAYARACLSQARELQEQLFAELRGRVQEDDRSAPERRGEFFYYWRMQEGQQYRIFCRTHGEAGAEQVLLDENALAEGRAYCRVNVFEPSPDQHYLAYSVDATGALVFDLYVKDLLTGELLIGPIANTAWTAAWANDSRTLFYTLFDASHRSYQLWRLSLDAGDALQPGQLVYHEPDDAFPIYVHLARSRAFLLLTIASATTSEVRYLPADQPGGEFRLVAPRQHWIEYYVEPQGNTFWIRTNEAAENFRLMAAPADSPGRENWREVLPQRAEVLVEDVAAFREHLVVFERREGLKRIRVSAPDGLLEVHYVAFPDPVYTFYPEKNPEYDTPWLRFSYSSLVTPLTTVDYDFKQRTWQVRKRQQVPSGYDQQEYTSERLYARAPDGARVPISLVYRRGLPRDGSHPLLLTGYGSYGYSREPGFDANRLSLLDRGFVFALAHVRGGSELGRAWYEQGRLMHKKNTFTDFIACAEHLVAEGYTAPERLAITGTSAGGLLVSAVVNMRPELFRAVVALVPFTNVITAILSPDLPLTVIEYEQWGHPDDAQAFEYMLSYSPYENVKQQAYPAILVRAGLNDLQVPYWDPAKWVARLRAYKTDDNRLLLLTNMSAGHGGSSGRYDALREVAQNYAFLLDEIQ
jgi:oligopeptidase B